MSRSMEVRTDALIDSDYFWVWILVVKRSKIFRSIQSPELGFRLGLMSALGHNWTLRNLRRFFRNSVYCFGYPASAAVFFFRRQPSRPNAPSPATKSGSAPGSGVWFPRV